jgi:osmotically-inducible protein OsmY
MKTPKMSLIFAGVLAASLFSGCHATKSPDVSDNIRKSLDQAGLKDVSVSQDRDKGVVTLSGHVPDAGSKSQADSIAKEIAQSEVVADEVAVVPAGSESAAKAINSDVDNGISKNLDAALIQYGFKKNVKYDVKSGVVTLSGDVDSTNMRSQAEQVAATVPYVQQVVNELQVKDQKATSSN